MQLGVLLIAAIWLIALFGSISHWSKTSSEFSALPWRLKLEFGFLRGFDGGVTAAFYVVTGLALIFYGMSFLAQIYNWMQQGEWVGYSLIDALKGQGPSGWSAWADSPNSWIGIHKILDYINPAVPAAFLHYYGSIVAPLTYKERAIQTMHDLISKHESSDNDGLADS